MVPFHIPSFYFACFVPVVFFIAFRFISSFCVVAPVVSSKHQIFANILQVSGINPLSLSAAGKTSRVSELIVGCRNYWVTKATEWCCGVLTAGPIPDHIAIIMDGNRRYARSKHVTVEQGYIDGALSLRQIISNFGLLKVKCITLYCFSLDNFNRPKKEVDILMNLFAGVCVGCSNEGLFFKEHDIRLNLLGRKELLYESARVRLQEVERRTKNNKGLILNLCIAYGSRDEITTAVERCVQSAVDTDSDKIPNITDDDIDAQLMTSRVGCPPVDILLRTGGDKRLSDFLLWQCCENTQIHFHSKFWPELCWWDLLPLILDYQRKVWSKRNDGKEC